MIKEFIKTIFNTIYNITKKIIKGISNIFNRIDGYIEDQIFYLFIFFAIQYIFLLIFFNILIGLNTDFMNFVFITYIVILFIFKLIQTVRKYKIHSFLIIDFIKGFKIKYFTVYFECFIIELLLLVLFFYININNNDFLGILLMTVIIQRIMTSIMKNYLGKILLNQKIEALNNGKSEQVHILESTYSESIYLIDHLYESMKKSLDVKYKSERLRTDLITNISHDIKTPLTSIINYIDLIKKSENKELTKEYLDILDYNAKRLKSMVVDLIEASKTDTGNIDLNYEIIELNELILQVYGQFNSKFEEKSIDFEYDSCSDNIFINIDGDQLSRVFENIIGNAVKYSKEDSKIQIKIYMKDNKLIISTSNESKEKLEVKSEDLLEQFVRGEKSRTSEGSGLGLYITKNLIELMKGRLYITIDKDIFTVTIEFKIKKTKKNN